jgi:hypothetical protein
MSTTCRFFAAPLAVLAIFGLVLTAGADPFASVVVTLPPEDQGDIFSPGVVAVESLNVKGKKSKKGKSSETYRPSTPSTRRTRTTSTS